uniref:NADH-ubiquinone oxidoreductase chain 5 n=2 Tax=Rhynchium TaxID=522435 RepID=A0A6M9ATM8_9HYME|nr:NADH dehydrogenase subunit 5 [Rhynchium aff. brunneum YN]YP_009859772.1 NADH dehydrogenase subunit 5 [Rhynchium aff. brunneum GX]QKK69331.1 NADH dehydrogenase subunit 5 [Rhynchium aff. brunneum YN]QKK69344.1 NADH dehydrogenase subunit 5 [Rhynchium aff. brunneum GX]
MIYLYIYLLMFCSISMFILALLFMYLKLSLFFYWKILNLNSFFIEFIFYIDWISLIFLSTVSLISSFVLMYSIFYMMEDKTLDRFFYLVLMFIMSMFLMILSPNIVSILVGWDGLGLVSYALIIYYQNWKSYSSGMVTVLLNRLGDVGILMMISLLMIKGSWNLMFYFNEMSMVIMLLVFSACTKSAQLPFSVWLPLAMAAPTPVSSLVHSSTLVTAGVYLMIRFNFFLEDEISDFLMFISSLTMFMSGLVANFETDLKKIIALSTLSQLGLMMSILSFGEVNLGFFHLIMHALFKSLLFMCSGIIIHLMMNNQDIRLMGGLINFYPYLSIIFLFASMSLCGLPFLSGFYSKDLIMEMFLMSKMNLISLMVIFISTMFTISYSVRLIYLVYLSNLNELNYFFLKNENNFMMMSMLILFMLSIFGGFMFINFFFYSEKIIILKFLEKNLIFLICFFGILLGYFYSQKEMNFSLIQNIFFSKMFGLEFILNNFYEGVMKQSFYLYKIDKGFFEFLQIFSFKINLIMVYNFFSYFIFSLNKILLYFIFLILVIVIFWFL